MTVQCRICKARFMLAITEKEYSEHKQSGRLIQISFPNMSPADRELLISGTCDNCWHQLFGEEK